MSSSAYPDPPSPSSSTNSKRPVERTPSNLRFQRRQSERAYIEGALRDGTYNYNSSTPTMDYAAAGSSPWANSPDASRTSFGDEAAVPRRDLPGPAMAEEGHSANGGEEHEQQRPAGSWSPEQQQQWQYQQQQQQQQGQSHGQDRSSHEENRRPHSARYHQNAPPHPQQQQQPRQQHQPQYKLQAKITGLERAGKKDPILRFDAYVCHVYSLMSVRKSPTSLTTRIS